MNTGNTTLDDAPPTTRLAQSSPPTGAAGALSATTAQRDPRWAAVLARDAAADGCFFYSVSTTGVYCKPSCASRPKRAEHVRFHATCAEAEQAGFRPCLRCRPDLPPLAERQAALIAEICRELSQADPLPGATELAIRAGLAAGHFQRLFKRVTGLTPHAYLAGERARRLRARLAQGAAVTEALLDAGYGSSSRLYEKADALLGMTPNTYRSGGAGARIRFALGRCSLGEILVAASARGVCAILLGDDPAALVEDLAQRFPRAGLEAGDAGFERLVAEAIRLVETPALGPAFPLDLQGTLFQQRVWQALSAIPAGTTTSYTQVAAHIGAPTAVRAVAAAIAANPLAVAVPCHRVLHRDGGLAGYRWGLARKRALLAREASPSSETPEDA